MPPRPRFVDFRAVKARVSVEQVLAHYGLLDQFRRAGDTLTGRCPIHQGSNPTQFRVSLEKNCWHCFSDCRCGGNVLDLVARREDCSVHEAALKLAEWFGFTGEVTQEPPERPQEAPAPRPKSFPRPGQSPPPAPRAQVTHSPRAASPPSVIHAPPTAPPAEAEPGPPLAAANKPLGFALQDLDAAHPYLKERGLDAATVAEFGLGLCRSGKTVFGRLAIGIHNAAGELVGYAGRWPGDPPADTPKYRLPKGFRKSAELFNLHRALKEPADRPLVIVEGFFDVFRLWQLGHRRVVALMGSSLSVAQEALL
ncbi:MAG TPA: CHC2 zinc finger domain-containing protein, partial [Lacipirellulaceae bacterium]|nr:CHC2 zinc finger domain-containing protein [Lacipirellulaceae bacterium]